MIILTKLNSSKFILNCDLIESIEETPDTVITLTSGKITIVAERAEQIVEKIMEYKRSLYSGMC